MFRSKKAAVGIALAVLLAFVGGTAVSAKTSSLRLAILADEGTLTPYTYVMGYPGMELVMLIYDALFIMDQNNLPQPWLVEKFTASEDAKIWTVTLRNGVKFQDGQPLTTADVEFTYKYFTKNPKPRFTSPLKIIDKIEVADARTIKFTLKKSDPAFPLRPLADVPILPKHVWEKAADPKAVAAMGTGPYSLVEYKPEQYYKLKANAAYFRGKPRMAEIIIPIIKDPTSMFTALKSGEIHLAAKGLSPELVTQFQNLPGVKVVTGPGYSTTLLQLNDTRYPLDQREFRQALALAIDQDYLVKTVLLGQGTAGNPGFMHPKGPWANTSLKSEVDRKRAQALLDKLGFVDRNGDGRRETPKGDKLELTMLVYASNPLRLRTAEIISGWFTELGVKTAVKALDPTTVDSLVWPDFDVAKGRDYDLSMWGWSPSMQQEPGRLAELYHSNPAIGNVNIGGFKSAPVDALAEQLLVTVDLTKRKELAQKLQAVLAQEVPHIVLYYEDGAYVYRSDAYDGYTYVKGLGIVSKWSFIR
jgi:peptide/nickel transport system substrate-binding protein